MAMGWLVQESLVHITEFLVTMDPDMPRLWSQDEDDRMIGEEPQGKGKVRTMDITMRDKANNTTTELAFTGVITGAKVITV